MERRALNCCFHGGGPLSVFASFLCDFLCFLGADGGIWAFKNLNSFKKCDSLPTYVSYNVTVPRKHTINTLEKGSPQKVLHKHLQKARKGTYLVPVDLLSLKRPSLKSYLLYSFKTFIALGARALSF